MWFRPAFWILGSHLLSEGNPNQPWSLAAQTRRLESREGTIEQQQAKVAEQEELLDHDRDIRTEFNAGATEW